MTRRAVGREGAEGDRVRATGGQACSRWPGWPWSLLLVQRLDRRPVRRRQRRRRRRPSRACHSAPTSAAPAPTTATAAPTTAVPTTISAAPTTTSAAPTTTASPTPTAPVAPKYHKYDKDPAVATYLKWGQVDAEASRLYQGDYPPLVALETNNRLSSRSRCSSRTRPRATSCMGRTSPWSSASPVRARAGRCGRARAPPQGAGRPRPASRSGRPASRGPPLVILKQDGQQWKVDGVYDGQLQRKDVT